MTPVETYQHRLTTTLAEALAAESERVDEAGTIVADCWQGDGQLFVFGTGHSHMFAEEAFYRAGGPVRVCPVLKPPYMLHEGAVRSTVLEREHGHAATVLEGYDIEAGRDVVLVVSNSGTNALPVEVAQTCRDRGVTVLAITSRAYAESKPGPRLHEVAHLALDNHCPPGDALVDLAAGMARVGPGSTVVGLALLNSVLVDAVGKLVARGARPDVFLSAGMPGAKDHNAALVERFRTRNPHI